MNSVAAHTAGQQLMVTAGKEGWFNNGQVADRSGRIRDIFLNPIYLNDQPRLSVYLSGHLFQVPCEPDPLL